MATVQQLNIPPSWVPLVHKIITWQQKNIYPVGKSNPWQNLARQFVANYQNSLLQPVMNAWKLLTPSQKSAWQTAAQKCGMTGQSLFTQDKSYRIKNNIAGNATPSTLHQYMVAKSTGVPEEGNPTECGFALLPYYYYGGGYNLKNPIQPQGDIIYKLSVKVEASEAFNIDVSEATVKVYWNGIKTLQGQTYETPIVWETDQKNANWQTITVSVPANGREWVGLVIGIATWNLDIIEGLQMAMYIDNVSIKVGGIELFQNPYFTKDISGITVPDPVEQINEIFYPE